MLSVFPAHAPEDAPFANQLTAFLQTGFDGVLFTADAVIPAGEDLITAAEAGFSADVVVLILSGASNPPTWPRERWEPLLLEKALETNTRVAVFLLDDCKFPQLLRRKVKFFDATMSRLRALRLLKRWLWSAQLETSHVALQSPELEAVYQAVADRPGMFTADGETASRFVSEAAGEFESVFWVPCHGRNLTQIAGDLGAQAGMTLDGLLEENVRQLRDRLTERRYLVIFDAPQVPLDGLIITGRTSYLTTTDAVRLEIEENGVGLARTLADARRFPEAYDALYALLNAGVETETCARELIWICEYWGRIDEANSLRHHLSASPMQQLTLF